MSGPSFNKQEIKDRIIAKVQPHIPSIKVLDAMDRDMKLAFGKNPNTVYLYRESFSKVSDGGGSGRVVRQIYNGIYELVIEGRKYVAGETSQYVPLKALKDAVFDAIIGFTPTGQFTAFDLAGCTDGDPADVVSYHVQKWHAQVLYQGVIT